MVISVDAPESLEYAECALKKPAVVVLPTDTIYGFSGIVPASRRAIEVIKGRENKPFIQLIDEPDAAIHLISDAKKAVYRHYSRLWPAPLTLIFPLHDGTTQAFRCPASVWLRQLIKRCGFLYSTSVNKAGQAPIADPVQIATFFGDAVSLIVSAGVMSGLSSTIVDCSQDEPKLIRQGSVQVSQ